MRVLSLTTLYPDPARPRHGIFVENRLRALKALGHDIRVVAPVPFFPFKGELFGDYGRFAAVPATDERYGIHITHPRYVLPPKLGMNVAPLSLAHCFKKSIDGMLTDGFMPDIVDAHYYYPDGVAAVQAAESFGIPCVVTARGTDINLIPRFPKQRHMILNAAEKAAASITVAEALRTEMGRLGADKEKITTLRNGVDLKAFKPDDHDALKAQYRSTGPLLLSVGHLIKRKGHDLAIKLLPHLPDAHLLIVGDGPERGALERLVDAKNIRTRSHFLGEIAHDELHQVYSAGDVLVLASSREGWPNVLLEAMACGTPCVAAPAWGCGEVITEAAAGIVAQERSVPALVEAVQNLLAAPPTRESTRAYAEQFSWKPVAKGVEAIWQRAARQPHAQGLGVPTPLISRSDSKDDQQTAPKALLTIDTEECFDWQGDFSQ
ncbi:MAG: glycosyltransferase family 4 protein, partial [Pseudomonadota bacterium]